MTLVRLDHFMAQANARYYATRDPYADFTTAPEIAQGFGEVLGAWAAVCWGLMRCPDPVLLIEAGPGRGTLMADALRALGRIAPDFRSCLRLHLIESSPRLREIQAARLPEAAFHESLAEVPDAPALLIGNEFLDALPIRQFVRRDDGWKERFVNAGAFVELDTAEGPSDVAANGTIAECGEAARDWVSALAARLAAQGGAALLLDYGYAGGGRGESLQALRDGQPVAPLDTPGMADMTAHVDFAAMVHAARTTGASVHGPVPQGVFLERLGFLARMRALARRLPPAGALAMMSAAQRVMMPERMGALFKALAICHPALPTPPGFER